MKFCTISDNHGYFPDLPGEFDFVVHSGDLYPYSNNGREINLNRDKKQREIEFQRDWIIKKTNTIAEWLHGKPFLFCEGNHDFYNPCEMLNKCGIKTIDLTNRQVEYAGHKWYGFPYVCRIIGEWNWELNSDQLWEKTQHMINKIGGDVDILVSHNPMYGILDKAGFDYIGNPHLQNMLTYNKTAIKLILSGHCHENPGVIRLDELDLLAVNSAGVPKIITYSEGAFGV